ncbi:MAG: hypothetical protein NTZ52_07800 [Chlamydiae bacterium]|nr:hypothetical protein [Chlamydiota bacterium]
MVTNAMDCLRTSSIPSQDVCNFSSIQSRMLSIYVSIGEGMTTANERGASYVTNRFSEIIVTITDIWNAFIRCFQEVTANTTAVEMPIREVHVLDSQRDERIGALEEQMERQGRLLEAVNRGLACLDEFRVRIAGLDNEAQGASTHFALLEERIMKQDDDLIRLRTQSIETGLQLTDLESRVTTAARILDDLAKPAIMPPASVKPKKAGFFGSNLRS